LAAAGLPGGAAPRPAGLRFEPLQQLIDATRTDDPVELGAVVGDEAHALDDDVVDHPAAVVPLHAVLDGDLAALVGRHPGRYRRLGAVDLRVEIANLLTVVGVDLLEVG